MGVIRQKFQDKLKFILKLDTANTSSSQLYLEEYVFELDQLFIQLKLQNPDSLKTSW